MIIVMIIIINIMVVGLDTSVGPDNPAGLEGIVGLGKLVGLDKVAVHVSLFYIYFLLSSLRAFSFIPLALITIDNRLITSIRHITYYV
ncbi:hypothetical protein [Pelosinus fermentans]|uniref:hypothetical protein n=2 Tax=Pelosinus TaxID=365348 RepID=UPI0012F87D71|nr:hypothetical protein [Pelosinus fermentans]